MKIRKIFLVISCLLLTGQTFLIAQTVDTARIFTEMSRLQAKYQARAVSFDISYSYASELHPDVILDSLKGNMDLYSGKYHYRLDNTETISNGRYNIILFGEEKLMYLAKPSTLNMGDPIQQMRLMMQKSGINKCAVTENGNRRSILISFVPGGNYREMEMTMDKASGYLTGMRYVVKTTLLMETQGADPDPQYGEYAIVQTILNNYKEPASDTSRFDEQNFFYKEGNELKTTPAYKDYKIFIGSPNL
jgi:hypothetical protein